MTKRVKKRYVSNVEIIDFPTNVTKIAKSRPNILPRSINQKIFLQNLKDEAKNIIFAVGVAGSGKTLIAVTHGIKLLQEGKMDKIVITRPAVSVDEDLGFLPGTLNEKMAPWTLPIFDIFSEYYTKKEIENMLDNGIIEIAPLSFMRGRTFKNSYIIVDEAQLTTNQQMLMVLTRIGENSKMILTGDLAQADRTENNGLRHFLQLFKNKTSDRISVVAFDMKDIHRHPVVSEVLDYYA